MDPALPDFDIFKKKPAAPAAPLPPLPSSRGPAAAKSSQTSPTARNSDWSADKNGGRNGVASVTVDGSGRIVAVDDQCTTVFGWKGQELTGQHLKVLLREGSDNHVASLLQQNRSNESSTQLFSLRVIARRMDGREFAASLTRLAWTPDAPVKTRNTNINLQDCWTAVFRELAAGSGDAIIHAPAAYVEEPRNSAAPVAARLEDVPQFQGSPAALRSANEELQKKLEAMAVDAWKKGEGLTKAEKERDELMTKVEARDNELKQARASLEQELERRKRFEAQLHQLTASKVGVDKQIAEQTRAREEATKLYEQARDQLSQAKLTADRAEAARQQESARADGFKQALANLQQGYDMLNARVGGDHHSAAEAKRRIEELESVVRGTSAEAERANAELDKRIAERSRLEAEWQDQVKAAKLAVERAEAAYKQEVARADRAERDLANVRHNYDELNTKLTSDVHGSTESKRRLRELDNALREATAEAERANALLQKQTAERNRLGSEWQEQVDTAQAAAERAEAAQKQEAARATRLERDLAGFRERYEELDGKLAAEQRGAAEARRRAKEVETLLRDNTAELERVMAERAKHAHGRGAAESELKGQLNAVKAEAERIEITLKEKIAQFNRLEQEVANLRYERDELQNKFVIEKDAGAKAKRRIKQLEKQVRDGTGNTERRVIDRHAEAELQAELKEVKAAAERAAAQAKQRIDELERRLSQSTAELARAKATSPNPASHRSDTSQLTSELSRLRENEATQAAEMSELERRVREGVTSLARVTAEVESERSERRRSEERFAALSAQLQQLHGEVRRHLDSEKANQTKVDELAERVQQWRRDKAA